jgi:hypothetical protein
MPYHWLTPYSRRHSARRIVELKVDSLPGTKVMPSYPSDQPAGSAPCFVRMAKSLKERGQAEISFGVLRRGGE